jgi:hypothetical protein
MKRASFLQPFFLLALLSVLFVVSAFAQLRERVPGDWKGEVTLPNKTVSLKIKFFSEEGDLFADLFTNNNEHYPKIPVVLFQNHVVFTFPYSE